MKEYRINIRFNTEKEKDRMIVAYLNGLRGTQNVSRNSFIIQAIYEKIVEGDREAARKRGNEISDFPICNKSFNLSYAGHDL